MKNDLDTVEELFDRINPVGSFKCRQCGETSEYTYDKSSPMYGSPLVICSHCNSEQLILGRLEPALDNRFRMISNYRPFIVVAILCFVVAVAIISISPSIDKCLGGDWGAMAFSIGSSFAIAGAVAMFMFRDTWRAEKKRGAISILRKSRARLQNPDYVRILLDKSYEVPRKYWPKGYKTKPVFKKKKTRYEN